MSQRVALRQDGQKHVALVISSPLENVLKKKRAPSKLSQTAIAEGEDILANVMNISDMGDMLELMDDDDFEPEGTITSFARNQLQQGAVASGPGVHIVDHIAPNIARISPIRAPPRLPYQDTCTDPNTDRSVSLHEVERNVSNAEGWLPSEF